MKYFIPEWDDRVDPKYDFITDTHSQMHKENAELNDVYMWDIFGLENVPFDGILISKMKIMQNKKKYQLIIEKGVHEVLRLPKSFEIMGDCGAWGYITHDEPPFKTKEIIEYYARCGFNYGVSIDHLIVPAVFKNNPQEKKRRWKITIENAQEFLDIWMSKDKYIKTFRPIGVAQGWDIESYKRAVIELLNMGYDYIGLGGLAKTQTGKLGSETQSKLLLPVLEGVWSVVKKYTNKTKKKIDIHVFGVARPNHFQTLASLGVTSFDSASPLRRAWLGATSNYFSINGKHYSAIRVPQTDRSPRAKRIIKEGKVTFQQLQKLEKQCLQLIRDYDKGLIDVNTVLKSILDYDKLIGEGREQFARYFERTLRDRPWEKCPCQICRTIGVEVIIFRGNNRNRRRGFHNTWVFYQQFRKMDPRILVFTNCTAKKDKNPKLLPAFQRYLPSPVFKVFWENVYDLPVEIGILSAKFGLIDWSKRIPYYDYKMQESDVEKFVEELKEKLKRYNKVFFIGLGLYRKVVQQVKEETGYDIEIYPKMEFTNRGKLDIIEYTKQMKLFREAILNAIPEPSRPISDKKVIKNHPTLEDFIK